MTTISRSSANVLASNHPFSRAHGVIWRPVALSGRSPRVVVERATTTQRLYAVDHDWPRPTSAALTRAEIRSADPRYAAGAGMVREGNVRDATLPACRSPSFHCPLRWGARRAPWVVCAGADAPPVSAPAWSGLGEPSSVPPGPAGRRMNPVMLLVRSCSRNTAQDHVIVGLGLMWVAPLRGLGSRAARSWRSATRLSLRSSPAGPQIFSSFVGKHLVLPGPPRCAPRAAVASGVSAGRAGPLFSRGRKGTT